MTFESETRPLKSGLETKTKTNLKSFNTTGSTGFVSPYIKLPTPHFILVMYQDGEIHCTVLIQTFSFIL